MFQTTNQTYVNCNRIKLLDPLSFHQSAAVSGLRGLDPSVPSPRSATLCNRMVESRKTEDDYIVYGRNGHSIYFNIMHLSAKLDSDVSRIY